MNPINIQKYILYCMGEGYLDKKRYSSDLTQYRSEERLLQARLDQILKAIQDMSVNPPQAKPLSNSLTQSQTLPLAQKFLQSILVPFQAVFNAASTVLANVLQPAIQAGRMMTGVLEQAAGKILSFFFGHKKDKTEEKELRDRDDFSETDLFTRLTTHGASNNGGGGKR